MIIKDLLLQSNNILCTEDLSSSELQQDDEVCDADADDAGEGAPADVEVPVPSQGANTLHLLEQELETLQPGPLLLLHQALLQGGGQQLQVIVRLLSCHCDEVEDRDVVHRHDDKTDGIEGLLIRYVHFSS